MSFDEVETDEMSLYPRRAGVVVSLQGRRGEEFLLGPGARRWLVGSGRHCDFVVTDPCVSNVHCVLERHEGGTLTIRDHRSRNGTILDGGVVEAAEVHVGSYLTLGKTTLIAYAAPSARQVSAFEILRGRDPVFLAMVDRAVKAAQTDCSVLIVGETGTGKDVIARIIHEKSRRAAGPFVAVNCGGIPRDLIASELFGHERGAFTGAHADRDGYFVEADCGTLFLDELGELPLEMQPHLLRALESRSVRRVGGASTRAVKVRIIAATNRVEGLGTDSSRLRLDLYHRLATVVIEMPPLRERMGDLAELVEAMLDEFAPENGRKRVSDDGWRALAGYAWPGNLRELRHAVSRAVTLGGEELGPLDFFPQQRTARPGPPGAAWPVDESLVPYQAMLRGAMEQALNTHGSIRAAAQYLGMAKSTFAEKARMWGLSSRRRPKLPIRGK